MRKPRDEGRSTRSSGTRTRVTAAPKKNTVPKVKPKAKAKPQPKKQGKDVERPMQVTVIRVRNPKTSKNIIPGGVSKQKSQQKRKTAAVVGALKDDLLKKLAVKVDDKFVNTLFEVSVVSKKVIARKKKKDEESMQSAQEKPLKREVSPAKQQVKAKKDATADTVSDVNPLKETEKKCSKHSEKKTVSKETQKNSAKEDKKSNKEDKKPDKKISSKACEKKLSKKTEKKNTGKDALKPTPKEIKKNTRGSKISQSGGKKKVPSKTKNKVVEENLKIVKTEKPDKLSEVSERGLEGGKKDSDVSKKDSDNSRRDREIEEFVKTIKKEPDESKKPNENTKKEITSKKEKDNDGQKKNTDVCKREVEENKKNSEQITKPEGAKKSKSTKDDEAKKLKIVKEEDNKKSKSTKEDEIKSSKSGKEEESKSTKNIKSEDSKTPKKVSIKPIAEGKKTVESKNSTKKINEKEKSKISAKKEPKKAAARPSSKSREVVKEEKKPTKKYVKRKPKIESELDGSAKISQILNAPKRHREASLNALAKVHCLYENESRGAIMDIIDKSEKLYQEERKLQEEKKSREEKKRTGKKQEDERKLQEDKKIQEERKLQEEKKLREEKKLEADKKNDEEKKKDEDKKNQGSITKKPEEVTIKREQVSSDEDEMDEAPARNLRTAPGRRSVGRHWDIFNALSSSSSEDSTDSSSERKPVEEPPKSPPKVPEKKVRRRRKRTEVIMDLKDMVVKKRMASLNASAMMAATYSMDKRSSRSDDDSLRKDSDSSESLSSPEVVEVVETSEDEVILSGRKKALVIVNQDNSDLTITGVYVNSTTRTRHEGFCSFAGMQYRISSTSHTQTETAVSTETTVHTVTTEQHQQQQGESSSRAAPAPGSDGAGCAKTYTPLGALSNMQPPGSPRYPPSPASSAFSAPPHHHPPAPPPPPPPHPHQEMHETLLDHSQGYFQPAGPLISTSQLKAGPSQEEMQGTSSQAVTYTTYPPHPSGYLEPPGYPPHAYPKYPPPPPPPPGYSHRRYFYPNIEPTYPPHYPHPSYYSPYTPPPQPPPHFRPGSYMDNPFHPCPCPMPQTCPKNVHTGPLTGTSKGSESNSTVPPVGASRGPVQLNPVALALPPEPNTAVNPPSPARGSAGLPPPASPALAQASWGTPPPPQSPGLLTAVEPQPRRKRRRTTSISPPPPDHPEKHSEEPPDKLLRPTERKVMASEKYDRLQNPVDRYKPDKTLLCDRLQPPSETIIQASNRTIDLSETLIQSKTTHNTDLLNQSTLFIDKKSDRLTHALDKMQQASERAVQSEKMTAKCKASVQCEKASDRSIQSSEKSVHAQAGRPPHPSDVISHSNDRTVHASDIRPNHVNDKDQIVNRSKGHDRFSERIMQPIDRISQSDRPVQLSVRVTHTSEPVRHPERILVSSERTLHERLPQPDRTKSVPQERVSRPTERLAPPVSDLQNGHSPPEADVPYKDNTEITVDEPCRKRSLSRESTDHTPKRRISVNKRAPRPKKLPSPGEADTPLNQNSKSPENIKVKKACVPLKNGRRKKEETEIDICQEVLEIANNPPLKWSNGWSWRGEPFTATVYIRDDRTEVRRCYPAMEHREGDIIHPRDCILLKSAGSRKNLPFVAKVAALWENPDDGEMMVSLLWYYRPEHTDQGRQPHQPPDEVFASRHKDSNSVACIEDKCYVLTFNEYSRYMKRCRQMDSNIRGWTPVPGSEGGYPRANRMPPGRVSRDLIFFCRKVYDFRLSRILKNPC